MMKGSDFTVASMDNHVLGLGLRSYFDFIINDNFFINLHNEIFAKSDLDLRSDNAALAAAPPRNCGNKKLKKIHQPFTAQS